MESPAKEDGPAGMSTLKKVLLFILAFLVLSFILQMGGIKVINKSTEDSVIERPHG